MHCGNPGIKTSMDNILSKDGIVLDKLSDHGSLDVTLVLLKFHIMLL
jgi:hypothetical protein